MSSSDDFEIGSSYLDESGTHGGDVTIMAGFLADARQWRKFEKRTTKLFARFRVDIFHTIDVKRTDKDFEGLPVDRKIEFLDEFHHIINETTEMGYAAILLEKDYKYYLSLPWPKKAPEDAARYTLLFRACMADAIDGILSIDRLKNQSEPRLHVVLESGGLNPGDVTRLYNSLKKRFGGALNRSLAGLTFKIQSRLLAARCGCSFLPIRSMRKKPAQNPLACLGNLSNQTSLIQATCTAFR